MAYWYGSMIVRPIPILNNKTTLWGLPVPWFTSHSVLAKQKRTPNNRSRRWEKVLPLGQGQIQRVRSGTKKRMLQSSLLHEKLHFWKR